MTEERPEGLIPKLFKKWSFDRGFTKEEREELRKITKDAYMDKARQHAKEKGLGKAKQDFIDDKEVNQNGKI